MFFKSVSGTCYYVTSVSRAEQMRSMCGYIEITSEEFFAWCEKNKYKPNAFTLY